MKSTFQERINEIDKNLAYALSSKRKYQNLRGSITIIFLLACTASIYFGNIFLFFISLILYLPLFITLVQKTEHASSSIKRLENLLIINKEELDRLNGTFTHIDDGGEFEPSEDHPYAIDLELFGPYSMFQFINRGQTQLGRQKLAEWMLNPTFEEDVLKERQKSVLELSDDLVWRQEMHAMSMIHTKGVKSIQSLLRWVNDTNSTDLTRLMYFNMVSKLFLVGLLAVLFVYQHVLLTFGLLLIFGIVNTYILNLLKSRCDEVIGVINKNQKELLSYSSLFSLVAEKTFNTSLLVAVKEELQSASTKLRTLTKFFNLFQLRGTSQIATERNLFYPLFNGLFLLDYYLIIKSENWRKSVKNDLEKWFEAVSLVETLASFSAVYFANSDRFCFPDFHKDANKLITKDIGHPLIEKDRLVTNDFDISDSKQIALITGSNMAGKSTFLRTIGINMVLAYTGGPVCCKKMSLSFFKLFTSLRTRDSLHTGVSSFKAELIRLGALLHQIKTSKEIATFILLDEILKGTNAADMHKGSVNLLANVLKYECFGLVSTHDTQLSIFCERFPSLFNCHFSSTITGEEIIFDYRLKSGVCKEFNASLLMRKIGIEEVD